MPEIWGSAAILAKLVLYVGITGATGLVITRLVFADLVAPLAVRMRWQAGLLAVAALVAAVLGFMLRGAALTGDAAGMTDPEMLGLLWQTPVGTALACRVAGLVLILVGLLLPRFGDLVALVGGLAALWSFAQIGHVPQQEITGLRLLLGLHLLGIAFWVGILGPLRALSLQPEHLDRAARLGHRFGQVALGVVPMLILAGLVLARILLGDLAAVVTTGYGQTLLIKLGLVGGVLTLAAANKTRFVPAMRAGDAQAAQHLARVIALEIGGVLAVFAATATLTSVLTLPG
ncbi:MAG: CopD family protein [Pelagimonas sp.]|jgi:putative copper resistance protein D|nr:CopD family protein [Pelagimonas sp.]